MPDLSTDRLVQIVLGLAAAGGIGFGGVSFDHASECEAAIERWREELQDEHARGQAREIRDADLCQEMIEMICNQ
jgi:hypothetical protein